MEAIDDDFVIGRPDASPSNAEYPHGEGSATVIKGQDAMLGHGGNITLKGGNAHGTSEHGGSVVLQPGKVQMVIKVVALYSKMAGA